MCMCARVGCGRVQLCAHTRGWGGGQQAVARVKITAKSDDDDESEDDDESGIDARCRLLQKLITNRNISGPRLYAVVHMTIY